LPLGWQISNGALERLASSLHQKNAYDTYNDTIPGYYKILNWVK
jgi:hemerythrin superfamily protein